MTRTHIAALLALTVAVPAAAAASYFGSSAPAQPCFVSGDAAYRISSGAAADYTVRIDASASPQALRLQVVDDPAVADFVLVDDNDGGKDCKAAGRIRTIRIDTKAADDAGLMVALTHEPAEHKIYVRSSDFSERDAAAFFAVIWQGSRYASAARQSARRN